MNRDDSVLGFVKSYFLGQLLLSFILALCYSLGFGLVGLPWGYSIGVFTGFCSFIPVVGSMVGLLVALIVLAINFSWPLLLKVLGVYLGIQCLEAFVLAPRIIGRRVGLVFWQALGVVIVGGLLFGPLGATVAIPLAAFLKFYLEREQRRKELASKKLSE